MATNIRPDIPGGTDVALTPGRLAESPMTERHAPLERALMDEFLRERGHTRGTVGRLPADERALLLRAASSHASLRLAEIEARAHLVEELE